MNKATIENVRAAVNKIKMCLNGKVEADIKTRYPEKPNQLDDWDKYKLIKSGEAKLKLNLTREILKHDRYSDKLALVEAYTYPVSDEQKAYDKAVLDSRDEKLTREMAIELAFNRVADERIFEMITAQEFLDKLEVMAQQKW
jgi:hypothetical protein